MAEAATLVAAEADTAAVAAATTAAAVVATRAATGVHTEDGVTLPEEVATEAAAMARPTMATREVTVILATRDLMIQATMAAVTQEAAETMETMAPLPSTTTTTAEADMEAREVMVDPDVVTMAVAEAMAVVATTAAVEATAVACRAVVPEAMDAAHTTAATTAIMVPLTVADTAVVIPEWTIATLPAIPVTAEAPAREAVI